MLTLFQSKIREIIEMLWCELGVFDPDKRKVRRRDILLIRQVIAYCLYNNFNFTYAEIGKILGYDHTTVINAVKKIESQLLIYADIQLLHNYIIDYLDKYYNLEGIGAS